MRLAEYNVLEWQLLIENTSTASTKYYYFQFDASTKRKQKTANAELGREARGERKGNVVSAQTE